MDAFQCKYYDGSFGYACKVENIVKTSSASSGILISGPHLKGKSNADVKLFEIRNHPLDAFPRNLQEKFPNMTHLWIIGCGLKQISKTDLIGLENLEILSLSGNNLTSLPDDLLADMTKLQWITIRDNKLDRLSSKLLKPVEKSLERADFSKNTKIDDIFEKSDTNRSLQRLMDIMDSLEPSLLETDPQPDQIKNTDQKHHQQLTTKFSEFKASGEFTDFTIKVRGKEFKVHKNILAAQSPVFRQTFTNDDGTTEKTFKKVKNFSGESFGNFLDFFYTGKIGDDVNALEVFELAAVFEVSLLKEVCIDKIIASLSEENALEVYNLAHRYGSEELTQKAFKVIQKMFPELTDNMVEKQDLVNRLVAARREYETVRKETRNLALSS